MKPMYSVVILAVAAFTVNVSACIMTPFLPIYAESLGATLGIQIGLFTSVFLLTRVFMNYYSGKRSDKLGRKRLIILGIAICAFASFLFAIPMGWYAILGVRAVQGLGSAMVWTPATALVGDLTPKGKRGFAMGIYNALALAGWVIGPGIGGAVQWFYRSVLGTPLQGSFQSTFLTFAFLQVATLFMVLFTIREPKPELEIDKVNGLSQKLDATLKRSLIVMSLLVFSFALIIALIEPLLVYHAQKAFNLTADEVTSGMTLVFIASGTIVILTQLIAGLLADRVSKKAIIAFPALAAQAIAFMIPFATNIANMGVLITLWYGLFSIANPAYLALLQDLFPQHLRGKLTGAFLTIFDLGSLAGPIIGFLLYDNVSAATPFIVSGVLGIATVISFLAYVRDPNR